MWLNKNKWSTSNTKPGRKIAGLYLFYKPSLGLLYLCVSHTTANYS